jgi:CRP-like cAMP-binding protein
MNRTKTNRHEELHGVTVFETLTSGQLDRVGGLLTELTVPAGKQLIAQGTPGRQAFIIVSGQADVTIDGQRVARLGPGEVVGEMALLDHKPRSATVTATEPMRIYVIDPRSFAELLNEPQIARSVLATEVSRLRSVDSRVASV